MIKSVASVTNQWDITRQLPSTTTFSTR